MKWGIGAQGQAGAGRRTISDWVKQETRINNKTEGTKGKMEKKRMSNERRGRRSFAHAETETKVTDRQTNEQKPSKQQLGKDTGSLELMMLWDVQLKLRANLLPPHNVI